MEKPAGRLFLVSTPIGNLEDMTLRGIRILREASLIAAEDTRQTRKLLTHFEISTPLIAYHEHNKLTRLDYILERLANGELVAVVSDAGTPCISDPGWELAHAAIEQGFELDFVPGASAPLMAITLSGFDPREFTYAGFPPRKPTELRQWFKNFLPELNRRPLVIFEAPHRLTNTLEIALEVLGDRPVAVCRELTKLFQEVRRELISQSLAHFATNAPRGEFTLVFAPVAEVESPLLMAQSALDLTERLRQLQLEGWHAKEAVDLVTQETGQPRKQIYNQWLKLKAGG